MNPRTAERLVRAARAAQALSETLWEELHEELAEPAQRRVAELSQRLVDVSASVALLAWPPPSGEPAEPAGRQAPSASTQSRSPGAVQIRDEAPISHGGFASPEHPSPEHPSFEPASSEPSRQGGEGPPGESPSRRESSPVRESPLRVVLVDELAPATQVQEPPSAPPEPGARALQEIEIRDERHEDAHLEPAQDGQEPSAWIGAIERRLERHERDRAPFAVLLVELADVERLRHAELPGEMSRLTGSVEAALSGELGPADSLTRESPGRYWLLAAETDALGSRELVERLASAVRSAVDHRRVPLEVAVGIALCPGDGDRAAELASRAEIALYAARASGKPVA
jgi:GGDEF domain-containing protein